MAGTATGDTKVTVTPALVSGNSYKYKTGATLTIPNVGDVLTTGYFTWDGTSDISAKTGDKILIVEVDSANKAVKGGQSTVTSKA